MSNVIEVTDDYSLSLKEMKEQLGIKPHDSFRARNSKRFNNPVKENG